MLAKGEAAGGLAAQEGESVAGFLTLALYVGEFSLGSGHFGLGSGEIGLRDGSGFELVVEKVHKFFPQGDGAAQGVEFGIGGAEQEVLCGDIASEGEDGAVVAGGGGIGGGAGALDFAPHLAPEVYLVAEVDDGAEAVDAPTRDGNGHGGGQIAGELLALGVAFEADVGRPLGGADAGGGASLIDAGGSGLQGWAGLKREGFEAVEFAVAEDFPPFATRGVIARGSGLPAPFRGGDVGGVGLLVIRADGAGGEAKRKGCKKGLGHEVLVGWLALFAFAGLRSLGEGFRDAPLSDAIWELNEVVEDGIDDGRGEQREQQG